MRIGSLGTLTIALALALAAGCGETPPADVQEADARPCRPGETHEVLAPVGAWNWCGDPRAVTHEGDHLRTYIGWVDDEGSVRIGAYDHDDGSLTTATLHERMERDDHDNPSILILPDGRLMAFYSPHVRVPGAGGGLMGMFYRVSMSPEDVTAWGAERQLATNTQGSWGYTYPNAVSLADEGGRIYLFWRGGNGQPSFSFSDEGEYWIHAHTLFRSGGRRPYAKYVSDGASTIHFAFTDGHPRGEPENSVYHALYRDGAFYRADGTRIKDLRSVPLTPEEIDRVYDAGEAGARAWVWDIALDADGRPVIVYAAFPEEDDHRYRYARWDGERWSDHEICASGSWFPVAKLDLRGRPYYTYYSGGVTLDHDDPSVVYLSREVERIHEIERWVTPDGGRTWESEPITCGSSKDNVRPVTPRGNAPGGPEVVWMHGDYDHYTQYETSLRMLLR
jgi:hypothetical protein